MDINGLKTYLCLVDALPQCKHGYNLCDWGANLLEPPCGCRLRLTRAQPDRASSVDDEGQAVDARQVSSGS